MSVFEKIVRLESSLLNIEDRSYLLVGLKTIVLKSCLKVCIMVSKGEIVCLTFYCKASKLAF